ncbi:MAG: transporter permease [Myxococcales bacterium]|nr:transporter permease [Myxococcales bacterium]
MSFRDAATFLVVTSFRNRVRAQWRRLRQPKYLVFTIIGLLYFWRALFHDAFTGPATAPSATATGVVEAALGAMALLAICAAWLFGGDKAALRFSEPEVVFLFTAPVGRRALIHFRLIRSLLNALLSAMVVTLFRARSIAHVPFFLVGAWLALGTLYLHLTAATLTRASLAEHGVAGWRRRLLTLGVIVAVLAAAWHTARSLPPVPPLGDPDELRRWAVTLVHGAPLRWVLFPIIAPLRVAFAGDGPAFLRALPPAVVVLAAHYVWASSSTVAFEEAADEASQKRGRRLETRRGGRLVVRRVRPLFTLSPSGPRWVAITWKNLLAGTRVLPLRLLLILGIFVLAGAAPIAALAGGGSGRAFVVAASLCAMIAALLALLGPQTVRSDLRMDLPNMDLLRSYPLSGREVVTAAIAAPALSLVAIELFFLLLAVSLSLGGHELLPLGLGLELAAAVVASLLLAAVSINGLVLRNAIVLYLPGWVPADNASSRGPEAIGQRVLVLAGTLVLILVGLAPPAIIGALAAWALFLAIGPAALVVGALCGAAVFAVEVHFALVALGRAFDRFDLGAT